jgi:hypothetical protein
LQKGKNAKGKKAKRQIGKEGKGVVKGGEGGGGRGVDLAFQQDEKLTSKNEAIYGP